MASDLKIPGSIEGIDAEVAKIEERLAALAAARNRALDAQRDAGRSFLVTALEKVKIGEMSRREAKTIAQAIERLGPVRLTELLASARD